MQLDDLLLQLEESGYILHIQVNVVCRHFGIGLVYLELNTGKKFSCQLLNLVRVDVAQSGQSSRAKSLCSALHK